MSGLRNEPLFLLSAIDRLTDGDPDTPWEPRPRRFGTIDDVKSSVYANLQWLLNARRPLVEVPGGRHHLQKSLLAYGLADFSHMTMETADDREELRAAIESAVRRFEPRLAGVKVSSPELATDSRDLHYRVDAYLNVKPAAEVIFDSVLRVPSRKFELRELTWTSS